MNLHESSDEAIVLQCREGNQAAWSTLVRRFQRLVYTVPRRARLNEDDAAEVFQATFTRLFRSIDRLEQPQRVRAWLVTTARHETLRLLHARKRSVAIVPGAGATAGGHDADHEAGDLESLPDVAAADGSADEEQWHEVRCALDRLEPRCRQLLELLYLQESEASYADVSVQLGMPVGSVGPTRSRCLAKLRQLLAG